MIGRYLAKIKDYGLSKTQKDKPQVVVQFHFEHEGQSKEFSWFGTLAADNDGGTKGLEITTKALIAMGLSIDNAGRLHELFKGPSSNFLDMNKEVALELQEETINDDQGKPKLITRVQWVNDPSSSFVIKKLSEADAVQIMRGIDLTSIFMKVSGNGNNQGSQNYNQNQGQNNNGQGYNQNNGQGYNGQSNNGYNQNNHGHNNNNGGQNYNQNQGQNNNGQGQTYKAPF